MTRELIFTKLFTLIATASGAVTTSRRLRHWADVQAEEQPALFMVQGDQVATRTKGLPIKWELSVQVYLYARTDDAESTPAAIINGMLDAICQSLEPTDGSMTQTLGLPGVSHCWIEGAIETDEGTLGEQSVAIIPIHILYA